jgi:uncharacterized protein (DUF2141 family)
VLNSKSSLKIVSTCFLKLICFSILGLLVLLKANAAEHLDIRPYEAADLCEADIAQIRVTVNNVGSGGILSVELYHDPDNFLNKKGRTRRIRIPATGGAHKVCFTLKQQGTYAVAAYHDVDGNRKLKKQWNRMPKEPFGLSNNPKLKFGFPKFSKSAFTTDSLGADITVNLQEP